MRIVLAWLRLDSRRRWRSLAVLGLLVALATMTEVTALSTFAVAGFVIDGYPLAGQNNGFPPGDSQIMRTIERPMVFQGRLFNPDRVDEVVVTPRFLAGYGKGVGDTLTLHL